MKSGVCPKCDSESVYCDMHMGEWFKSGHNRANTIPVAGLRHAVLDHYVCVSCGYTESYISNPRKLALVQKKWLPAAHVHSMQLAGRQSEPLGSRSVLPEGKECPACGNRVDSSWQSCPYCGQPLV